jgi:steroid delta-isomerase-like uncharacterized protein
MSHEAHKKLVRLYFEAFNAGEGSVFDQIIADGFEVHAIHRATIWMGGKSTGPASCKSAASALRAAWPDGHVSIGDMMVDGDRVIAIWTFHGTHKGSFLGIAPTNRHVRYSGINIFRVADGRLAEGWDMVDRLGMWQQLGVLPETSEFLAKARVDTTART